MSTIDEIMEQATEYGGECWRGNNDDADEAWHALRGLIADALADAERKGAEAMRERAAQGWDGCMYDAPGETIDIGADIRALPLPTGQRHAVLLTDEQIEDALCRPTASPSWLLGSARTIEAAVLSANGLEVRRG